MDYFLVNKLQNLMRLQIALTPPHRRNKLNLCFRGSHITYTSTCQHGQSVQIYNCHYFPQCMCFETKISVNIWCNANLRIFIEPLKNEGDYFINLTLNLFQGQLFQKSTKPNQQSLKDQNQEVPWALKEYSFKLQLFQMVVT